MTNELEKQEDELIGLLDISKEHKNMLKKYSVEISSLKEELKSIKEINDKTTEFLSG